MERDVWYTTILLVVSGFIIGVLAIPDQDIPFGARVTFDVYFGVVFIIFSVIYFVVLRNYRVRGKQNEAPFKNMIAQEIKNISNDFYILSHQEQIPNLLDGVAFSLNEVNYLAWTSKTDEEKIGLLGAKDYHILQKFYDAINTRNDYLHTKDRDIEAIKKLNQSSIDAYNEVIHKIKWLILPASGYTTSKIDFDVEKLAKAQDELRKEEERRKKLNEKLFKPWKEVSISGGAFHIRFDIGIDPRLLDLSIGVGKNIGEPHSLTYFEAGREFLVFTSDYTRTIWKMWEYLEVLKDKYNSIGEQAQKRIDDYLLKAYPSLQPLEAGKVISQNCYVIDNITPLIWYMLKESFLKNGQISWERIVLDEKIEDNIWRLKSNTAFIVLIQSRDKTTVNERYFKETIQNLILTISEDLKQLDKLHRKIMQNLEAFREKMNNLTVDIDLNNLDTRREQLTEKESARKKDTLAIKSEQNLVKSKERVENIEEKPKTGEVAIAEIIKPELSGISPLNIASLPAEGWIGVKIVNDSDIDYKGCRGKVKTDVDEFSLFDWEEFLRNSDRTFSKSAEPYMSFILGQGTKRLYANVKTNTIHVSVTLDVGRETVKKELTLPSFNNKKPTTENFSKSYDGEQLQYRFQLKGEIDQIRRALENVEYPKEIPYPVWLCNYNPERKRKLIGNDGEYELIQRFYTVLQNRYDYQRSMNHPDAEFVQLNTECIDAYITVMKEVVWLKDESNFRQTEEELLQPMYFFFENWGTYRKLMEGGNLKSPQKEVIKWCSDQIKLATVKAHVLNLDKINAVIPQIEAISNDMALLGMDVLQTFPTYFSIGELERDEIQHLIFRGEAVCKKLKEVIPRIEQSFMKEGDKPEES